MRRRLALALGVLVLLLPGGTAAEGPAVVPHVLPGGLRLLLRHDPSAQVVSVSLLVRSGSRYDTPETAGLSNFVQRVMIRGTASRSARQIVEAAEDIGGSVEASADVEYAEIRGGALAGHVHALLELIADVALAPAFPPDEVERERRLIASQIQTRAETPFSIALDTLTAQLYGSHPLAWPILGRKASVERLGREDLVRHHRRVYRTGSMVLAVSGGVERETLRRHVQRLFARLPVGEIEEPAASAPTPSRERRVLDRPAQQAQILMGFLGPAIGDPDYAPGKIMTAVLGGGVAGRLFVKLRDERGLAYSLGMLNPARIAPASFVAYVSTSDDNVERAESSLRHEIERFRAGGPSEAEVARAKAYVLGNLAMDRRTNARHAWYLAFFELAGFGWDYPERYARALQAVSAADVARVARRYLENPAIVVVRPPS
jgi:zinc protease